MENFVTEIDAALGLCVPTILKDKNYCAGYVAQAANQVAELRVDYPGSGPEDWRNFGLGDASSDIGLHLFASKEFYDFRPCLKPTIGVREVRDILQKFIGERPEQLQNSTAVVLLAKALYFTHCPGIGSGPVPNVEQCTTWTYYDDEFGTENKCDKPVVIQFMASTAPELIERRLEPGERMRTGLNRRQIGAGWWMFATCPDGYITSVPFSYQNLEMIINSNYLCARK